MNYVSAFRTHSWNDPIAQLAARLAKNCQSSKFVVLADETNGSVDVQGHTKVAHTNDTTGLGLPKYPAPFTLWYNGDYALYFLQRALPNYDYYVMSEYDVAVNADVDTIIRAATERGLDFIAHNIHPSTADWYWHSSAVKVFRRPQNSRIYFMVVSQRALLLLLEARLEFAKRFSANDLKEWPFCEYFIPSVLHDFGNMRMADLREFADVQYLQDRPRILFKDERAHRPGALVHPVVGTRQYVSTLLAEHRLASYFRPSSNLRKALEPVGFREVAWPLTQRIGKAMLRRAKILGRPSH